MTNHINMRSVLFGGAILSSIIGVFFISKFIHEILKLWPDIPHDRVSVFTAFAFYWAWPIYILLAFAPLATLCKMRSFKRPIWHFVIIGAAEAITFIASLAMLIP